MMKADQIGGVAEGDLPLISLEFKVAIGRRNEGLRETSFKGTCSIRTHDETAGVRARERHRDVEREDVGLQWIGEWGWTSTKNVETFLYSIWPAYSKLIRLLLTHSLL